MTGQQRDLGLGHCLQAGGHEAGEVGPAGAGGPGKEELRAQVVWPVESGQCCASETPAPGKELTGWWSRVFLVTGAEDTQKTSFLIFLFSSIS